MTSASSNLDTLVGIRKLKKEKLGRAEFEGL